MHVQVNVSRTALLEVLMVSVLKEADKGPLGSGREVPALSQKVHHQAKESACNKKMNSLILKKYLLIHFVFYYYVCILYTMFF